MPINKKNILECQTRIRMCSNLPLKNWWRTVKLMLSQRVFNFLLDHIHIVSHNEVREMDSHEAQTVIIISLPSLLSSPNDVPEAW